ncbi:protein gurken [Eupeodes corollae]|uniref:protein gurken n=1 Tax=Eupeodes corollae TaxID=290404 RepID=UPI002490156E|nr:protein gurken [Eupeodes corollae]
MIRINIILMLSTIIPDLDCCSSFTIFNRKSIQLYPNTGIELSLHKPIQFQQSHHNHHSFHQQQTPPSPPPAFPTPQIPLISRGHGEVQTNSRSRYKHLPSNENNDSEQLEEEKLNRSSRLYFKEDKARLDRKLANDYPENVFSTIETTVPPIETPTTEESQKLPDDDAQYKLINEIVSLECVDFLKLEFCLNGGRCFLYPILNHSLSSCECAEGFVGERCEAKSYEFIPRIRPRLVLAKTRGGPLIYGLAFVDILFLLFLFCKNYNRD